MATAIGLLAAASKIWILVNIVSVTPGMLFSEIQTKNGTADDGEWLKAVQPCQSLPQEGGG